MKLTVLIDNVPAGELTPEWGLSAFLEVGDSRILLDTGASRQFLFNAEQLGIDVSSVDFAVLSHAHYDHANGMEAFFEYNSSAVFCLAEGAGENCWSCIDGARKYIGIKEGIISRYSDRIRYFSGVCELVPGVWLVPHSAADLAAVGEENGMYVLNGENWEPDDLSHEQSLVVDTEKGLFVLNSCSHGGFETIVNEVLEAFPGRRVAAYFGGLHLYRKTDEEVREQAERIRATGVKYVFTGHCTGENALRILREELGDCVKPFYCGMKIEL